VDTIKLFTSSKLGFLLLKKFQHAFVQHKLHQQGWHSKQKQGDHRYMVYVKQELAEPNQSVKGVIIALLDDTRIRCALAMTPYISFYRYKVSFKLTKAS
jgi:hypothetical protein